MRTEPRAGSAARRPASPRSRLPRALLAIVLVLVLAAVLAAAAAEAGLLTPAGLWLGMFAVGGGCATAALAAIRRWSGGD